MTQSGLHTRVFGIEGIPDPWPPDNLAAIIAAGVIGTLRDHLLRDNLRHRMPETTILEIIEKHLDIATLVCKVPDAEAGPVLLRLPSAMSRGVPVEVVRTNPAKIADMCTSGLRRLLIGTDLLREKQFHSGPEPIGVADLRRYIESLPDLRSDRPEPANALDYVTNIQLAASQIFGKITGGSPQVPSVTCEVIHLQGSTFSL